MCFATRPTCSVSLWKKKQDRTINDPWSYTCKHGVTLQRCTNLPPELRGLCRVNLECICYIKNLSVTVFPFLFLFYVRNIKKYLLMLALESSSYLCIPRKLCSVFVHYIQQIHFLGEASWWNSWYVNWSTALLLWFLIFLAVIWFFSPFMLLQLYSFSAWLAVRDEHEPQWVLRRLWKVSLGQGRWMAAWEHNVPGELPEHLAFGAVAPGATQGRDLEKLLLDCLSLPHRPASVFFFFAGWQSCSPPAHKHILKPCCCREFIWSKEALGVYIWLKSKQLKSQIQ